MLKIGEKFNRNYTVMGTKRIIHGPLFPNRNLVQVVAVKGKRGATGMAYVERDGTVQSVIAGFGYFEGEHILDGRG